MSGFVEFTFGSGDENVGKKSEKFKGEGGRSYRISLAWWPGVEDGKLDLDASPKFVGGQRHYIEGVGYVMNQGPEYTTLAGGPPRMAVATIIVVWPTDSSGNVDGGRLKSGDFKVMPWIFSGDKYKSISPIHKEFPQGQHDMTVACTDTKYQKMTFSPCRESLLRKLVEGGDKTKDFVDTIISEVQRISSSIQDDIGRELTVDQIREKMSGGGAVPTGASSATATTSADIDDLVDGLLDD